MTIKVIRLLGLTRMYKLTTRKMLYGVLKGKNKFWKGQNEFGHYRIINNVMGIHGNSWEFTVTLYLSLQFNSMQVTMVYKKYKVVVNRLISQCLQ